MSKGISTKTRQAALAIALSISAVSVASAAMISVKTISDGKAEDILTTKQMISDKQHNYYLGEKLNAERSKQNFVMIKQPNRYVILDK